MEIANLLNVTFVESFNHSVPELTTSDIPNVSANDCLDNLLCTEGKVYELLSTLD